MHILRGVSSQEPNVISDCGFHVVEVYASVLLLEHLRDDFLDIC